jgi:ribokinase
VVVGSTNMDLITETPKLPQPGQTLLGTDFSTAPGGKGGNQAVAAARAGGDVQFIGAVGDDDFGIALRARLDHAGVGTDRLRTVAGPSGIAAITVDAQAENTIVVVPGANGTLTGLDDHDRAAIADAAVLVLQLEIPIETVVAAARTAARAGVAVLLNPSPVRDLPGDLIDAVTVLVVNQGEAEALGSDILGSVPHLVTTVGGKGAVHRGPDGVELAVAAPTVEVVDTTGAGDAFTGALAVAWAAGADPRAALEAACAAGAEATTHAGA